MLRPPEATTGSPIQIRGGGRGGMGGYQNRGRGFGRGDSRGGGFRGRGMGDRGRGR